MAKNKCLKVKFRKSVTLSVEPKDGLKLSVQSSVCLHACLPLFRWGRVVPVWPWRSCLCRWFLATDSYQCAAGHLMWSWQRSSDIAAYWSGRMTWTPERRGGKNVSKRGHDDSKAKYDRKRRSKCTAAKTRGNFHIYTLTKLSWTLCIYGTCNHRILSF